MGIRSLLRNAFGRSKAAREESNEAASGTRTPETATIPEAREEATPEPAAPRDPAVPTARTAPTGPPPASVPTQATTPDPAKEPASGPAKDSASDLVSQAFDNPKTPQTPEPRTGEKETAAAVTAEAPSEAEAKDEAKAETETKAEDKAKAETTTEPANKTAAEPEPEPNTAPEFEPKTNAAPEPAPAAEPDAEPEATATPEPTPDPATESASSPEPTSENAHASTPTSLTKVEAQAPALVSLYKAARVSLEKQGLATQRAAVYLVLDRSGSMRNYYKDGTVQHLAEQALGLSANLDDDGTVPVVFFSTDVDGTADIDLANYEGRIEELHAGLGHMGRTNYHWAINAVIEHYEKSGATDPAFVIFQTDGAPTSKPAAEKALCEAAKLPIFWQFVGFGDPDAKGFDFLRKLDDLAVPEKRVVDNAGFFHAGRDPRSLADADLYQQLMVEFPAWLTEARAAGILPA
ncbi:VWA domain-containing protein [Streptomyces sp. NPDC018019]|uniref:VWA domain-containing protein n=1 Tax=Streptomyces sp. NPDC018019 TaxID=3365030 RepID=UPI003799A071